MRISDWSSDVCSSDLVHANAPDCGGMAVGNSPRRGRYDPVLPTIRTGNLGKIASDDFFGERYVGQIHHDQRPAVSGLSSSKTAIDGFSETRSEEHTSELQSLMRISYAVFCLKKKKTDLT